MARSPLLLAPLTLLLALRPQPATGDAAELVVDAFNGTHVPKFAEPISNVTTPVGREAILVCVVEDLSTYKVAWLRVDTQTILTIAAHVITKNHRIGVTHSDRRTWFLHIRDVRESDRGWYMCQINTDPMKSQLGYLEIVVPPDILDQPTSTDLVVREGDNVTLRCAATGSPQPTITWRREGGEPIPAPDGGQVQSVEGAVFRIARVSRLHMGPYLCIASNGVPPSVSKRISLVVHFPPVVRPKSQLVGAYDGRHVTIECSSEAYPKSINYWTRDQGEILAHGNKYEPSIVETSYKVHMKLTIRSVGPADYGQYVCVSKNSLGDTEGVIRVYGRKGDFETRSNEVLELSNSQHISKRKDGASGSLQGVRGGAGVATPLRWQWADAVALAGPATLLLAAVVSAVA
ncbi:opioid-binding protein/cell adhesion molecule homolog isoform X1 [Schistocerca gregaria]|uniref:opioid-binding protein/cell adhesion molecule homolog isoform X1 n=1 Tax=Schistocerca gregaria TaxID=7010 RepID=UPI00211E9A22|nr:opioid-binding protein/cell adhesion molecule homolog isoform X1 [Schistocerca gregaria]